MPREPAYHGSDATPVGKGGPRSASTPTNRELVLLVNYSYGVSTVHQELKFGILEGYAKIYYMISGDCEKSQLTSRASCYFFHPLKV